MPGRLAQRLTILQGRRGGGVGDVVTLSGPMFAVRSPEDVVALLEATINDVRAGRLDVRTAHAVGTLANAAIKAIAQADLEARLEALEAVLEPARRQAVAYRRRA